jgi:hypothetical protein
MDEHRNNPRHRVLKLGSISFKNGGGIDCTIRNLSVTGALLEVASPLGVPDDFELQIRDTHDRHSCHVVWRKQTRMGVAFR